MVGTRRLRFVTASRLLAPVGSLLLLVIMGGCIELSDDAGGVDGGSDANEALVIDPEPVTERVGLVCTNSVIETTAVLFWELTVDPAPIESGGKFSASFNGVALFPRSFFEPAQVVIAGGVTEVNLLDLQLTVVAHEGATGPDVVLTMPVLPYQCTLEDPPGTRPECDPAHDLSAGPGPVGNTDCQPEGAFNPCGRFVDIPTSEDCAPEGTCWNLGRENDPLCPADDFCEDSTKNQCIANGFCVTGDVESPLAPAVGEFVADLDGEVLFGWYDPNRGSAWDTVPSIFEEPIGPNGIRAYVGSVPVAFECVLGGAVDDIPGPLPDDKLISFDIPEAACLDDTRVCPQGFASSNDGDCRFSAQSAPFFVEDPITTENPSLTSCQGPVNFPVVGETSLPSEAALESESLVVRATTEVKNVDDEACVAGNEIIAGIEYFGEQHQRLTSYAIVFNLPTAVSFSYNNPLLRSTSTWLWEPSVAWSTGSDVCCERTFQTTWSASVSQCEDW